MASVISYWYRFSNCAQQRQSIASVLSGSSQISITSHRNRLSTRWYHRFSIGCEIIFAMHVQGIANELISICSNSPKNEPLAFGDALYLIQNIRTKETRKRSFSLKR